MRCYNILEVREYTKGEFSKTFAPVKFRKTKRRNTYKKYFNRQEKRHWKNEVMRLFTHNNIEYAVIYHKRDNVFVMRLPD